MNKKISQLTTLGSPDDSDLLLIVDVSDTTGGPNGTTKNILKSTLLSGVSSGSQSNIFPSGLVSSGQIRVTSGGVQVVLGDSLSEGVTKTTRIAYTHYLATGQSPVCIVNSVSNASNNIVRVGGGNAAMNAATSIEFYAASNNTTLTGSKVAEINLNGLVLASGSAGSSISAGQSCISNSGGITYEKATVNGTTAMRRISRGGIVESSGSGNVSFNLNDGLVRSHVLNGNATLALTNVVPGDITQIKLKQDSAGNRTVTWFSTINWAGGSPPTLTTTGNKADWITIVCTASGQYDGTVAMANV